MGLPFGFRKEWGDKLCVRAADHFLTDEVSTFPQRELKGGVITDRSLLVIGCSPSRQSFFDGA